MHELGIEVIEELKLVTDEEWSTRLDSLKIPKIKIRKLKVALDCLSGTGPIDAFIDKPLPGSCHNHDDDLGSKPKAKPASSSNSTNKRKSCNFNMKVFFPNKNSITVDLTSDDSEKLA